jgi:hypothetical protein
MYLELSLVSSGSSPFGLVVFAVALDVSLGFLVVVTDFLDVLLGEVAFLVLAVLVVLALLVVLVVKLDLSTGAK